MTSIPDTGRTMTKDLARVLGVTPMTVRNLKNAGVLVETGPGKYDLAAAVPACVEYVKSGRATGEVAEAKRRVLGEQLRKLKMENDLRERDSLAASEVYAVVDAISTTFKSQLDGLPGRMAHELAGLAEPALVRQRLLDECRRILADTAARLDRRAAV